MTGRSSFAACCILSTSTRSTRRRCRCSTSATSDRNFYDRCYFNAHDRTGDVFLITGLGVYPNLGVIDAYATVRVGDTQCAPCASPTPSATTGCASRSARTASRCSSRLQRIRLVCDGDDHGVGFDLTWDGSFPRRSRSRATSRTRVRSMLLDACRFAQVGTWAGELRVDGEGRSRSSPTTWVGTRDRSWGIRPVGEPEPPGRAADRAEPTGFWWLYVPLRFEDFAVVIIVQEQADGHRTLNDAMRVWPDGRRRAVGWPEIDIQYRSGTRHPERATLHLTDARRQAGRRSTSTRSGSSPLHIGAGYGGDPDWAHGQWRAATGRRVRSYDLTDPAVVARIPFGVIDHVARATCDGAEGWGLFEHGTIGRHDPTGFADFISVAP